MSNLPIQLRSLAVQHVIALRFDHLACGLLSDDPNRAAWLRAGTRARRASKLRLRSYGRRWPEHRALADWLRQVTYLEILASQETGDFPA